MTATGMSFKQYLTTIDYDITLRKGKAQHMLGARDVHIWPGPQIPVLF